MGDLLLGLIILIFSAILHEVAHGYVADRLGDPTARLAGRLTLNPLPHIDPLMSVFLPLLLIFSGSPIIFGAAKPVPVDPFNLREGRKDLALVALAGPLTNILLAIVASLFLKLLTSLPADAIALQAGIFYPLLSLVIIYNILLAVINLLPIPPLDGSKVFSFLLPEKEAAIYLSLSSFGIVILLFVILFSGQFIFDIVRFFSSILGA